MGINIRKRILLSKESVKSCSVCQKLFSNDNSFCPQCGNKLESQITKVYANIGKKGLKSYSIKLPNGTTINSKGNVTIALSKGISYTIPKG